MPYKRLICATLQQITTIKSRRTSAMSTTLGFKTMSSSANFSQAGQNQYRPIRKKPKEDPDKPIEFDYFKNTDRRYSFSPTQDPAYLAFDHIDSLPLDVVFRESTKETLQDLSKELANISSRINDFARTKLRTPFESIMLRR